MNKENTYISVVTILTLSDCLLVKCDPPWIISVLWAFNFIFYGNNKMFSLLLKVLELKGQGYGVGGSEVRGAFHLL